MPINTDTLEVSQYLFSGDSDLVTTGGETANESVIEKLLVETQPAAKTNNDSVPEFEYSPISKYLSGQQKSKGNDQVFVQIDRNIYKPGDTIYFEAYIRDQFTGIFDSRSVAMYALLFNENNIKIDSSRFKISYSTVSGWMAIPANADFGKYHFVAFTSTMQNFDPADAFQLDLYVKKRSSNLDKIAITFNKEKYNPGDTLEANIKITDPLGSPVNKQKITGSFLTDKYFVESDETKTNNTGECVIRFTIPDTITSQPRFKVTTKQNTKKESVTKDVYIPYEDPYFELRFLPEGGTFVEGLEQRIGFNATNFKGQPLLIEGLLKNSSGSILDTIKSGTFGPGCFSCTAQPGLYVELIKGLGSEKIWPLPVPVTEGFSLYVTPIDYRSFAVEVQSTNYNSDTVTVTGTVNTTQVFSQELILNKKQRMVIVTDQLPAGVANITLFNKDLRPVAERLFYVNSDKHLKFTIETDKVYEPGQETELSISVTDGLGNPAKGFFSIAVTDSVTGISSELFTPGIEYAFNYQSHLINNLPPKVLAKGLENMTDTERDLLLMAYGWSQFNWDFTPGKTEDKQIINYDMLKMRILYSLPGRRAGRSLNILSLEGLSIAHLTTDQSGEISFPLDSLPEITRSVTLVPDVKNKKSALGSMLSIPFNEQYFKSNKLFIPQPEISSDEYSILLPHKYIPMDENIIELPEVTITGHALQKKIFHDQYEEQYQYANVKSLDYKALWSSYSLESAIRKLVPGVRVTQDNITLNNYPGSLLGGATPALIVLDGMPLRSGWSAVSSMSPSQITSLTIVKGISGFSMYGQDALGGIIFVNTRSRDPNLMQLRSDWISQNIKDKMLVPIKIYRPTIEFYTPTKLEFDIDPLFQDRSTILWKPEVFFDGKGPIKIKYSNLKRGGPVIITINGVSANNLMGSGRASYMVQ